MKHPLVDAERLAQKLRAIIGRKRGALQKVVSKSRVEQSRISRFCAGEFRRMTPPLQNLCAALGIDLQKYILRDGPRKLPNDFVESVRRLVGKNPRKIQAVRRLVQNIQTLVQEQD